MYGEDFPCGQPSVATKNKHLAVNPRGDQQFPLAAHLTFELYFLLHFEQNIVFKRDDLFCCIHFVLDFC